MGSLLQSCAEVREPIELSFGLVTVVGEGMGVLDEDPRAPKGRGSFGFFFAAKPPR